MGTPNTGRKKKEEIDPGRTMGTDIEDYPKPSGKQAEVNLEDIKFHKAKKKKGIQRKHPKLRAQRVESPEASPPTRRIHVVL